MVKLKRVLCPTDFSKFACRAADYGVALARRYRGEVHFVHVLPDALLHPHQYPYVDLPVFPDPTVREEAVRRLDAFASLCRSENVETRASVLEGATAQRLLDTAEKEASDVICIGTHGREGFERLVLGSVAEKVVRQATCPVLTVSEEGDENALRPAAFEHILCAVDFETLSVHALDYAVSLARERGARLTLVNVLEWLSEDVGWMTTASAVDKRNQAEAHVTKRLEGLIPYDARDTCDVTTIVRGGKPYREILAVQQENDVDLIVMGVRGRNPLDRVLFGSTAEHVVRQAECPVLTIRS